MVIEPFSIQTFSIIEPFLIKNIIKAKLPTTYLKKSYQTISLAHVQFKYHHKIAVYNLGDLSMKNTRSKSVLRSSRPGTKLQSLSCVFFLIRAQLWISLIKTEDFRVLFCFSFIKLVILRCY